LWIAISSVGSGGIVGVVLGILAAFYPRLDMLIMRLMDVFLAFPGIIIALTIISILGPGITNMIVAIAIYQVPQFARLAHGLTLMLAVLGFNLLGDGLRDALDPSLRRV